MHAGAQDGILAALGLSDGDNGPQTRDGLLSPRVLLAIVRAATLVVFIATGPSIPSRLLGAAALYVIGACVLGGLRRTWRTTDIVLFVATVSADIAWCSAACLYLGPQNCLPTVAYTALMAAIAASVSGVAAAAIGVSAAFIYCLTSVLVLDHVVPSSVLGQLVGFQTATIAAAGILSGCIASQWRLVLEVRKAVGRLAHLNDATAFTSALRGTEDVGGTAVKQAAELVRADGVWTMLLDTREGGLVLGARHGVPSRVASPTVSSLETGVAAEVMRSGESVVLRAAADGRLSAVEAALAADGPLLAVPLPDAHIIRGVMLASRSSGRKAFREADVAVLSLFCRSVGGALYASRLIRNLHLQATLDSLTGLEDQGAFHARLAAETRMAQAKGQPLSLIVADVDGLKTVNDTYGHGQGTRVLCAVGDALREVFRATDTVARYGGDEFAVLLPGATLDVATRLAERARAQLRQAVSDARLPVAVSVSWGVASLPEDAATDDALFAIADSRLYQAKHAGGDCVVPPAVVSAAEATLRLEA